MNNEGKRNHENVEQIKKQRKALFTGGLAHAIHDGLTDMLYILFPIWQAMLGLSFAEVGFLKTLFSGTMALFQVPSSIISNRIGEIRMLILGTLITSSAIFFLGWGQTSLFLGCLLVIGAVGSSVQHPLSSSLITSSYQNTKKRRIALSTFNVCGDIGKLILPGTATFLITQYDWTNATKLLGLFGLLVVGIIYFTTRTFTSRVPISQKTVSQAEHHGFRWKGKLHFWSLSMIGILDSATRMGFLTFFPFLLREKGAEIGLVGIALTSVFAGGAFGKFVCGIISTRLGAMRTVIITEVSTALCIFGIKVFPLKAALLLAPIVGIALNGTSSVLYGSVPELVSEEEQKQAFSLFYTVTIGSGAVSPFLYGLLSDQIGIESSVLLLSLVILITIPLTLPLRKKLD